MAKITVLSKEIAVQTREEMDFICLTDIARYKDSERTDDLIRNWLRNRNTIEFLGIWEQLNNPNFKPVEFDGFRKQAGLNSFTLTPKQWIESTHATGIVSKAGRYGGTYAHKDIRGRRWWAPECCLWMGRLERQRMLRSAGGHWAGPGLLQVT
jgi:hypothetical protein